MYIQMIIYNYRKENMKARCKAMKKLFRTCDTETVFYDDEVAKARTYYDAPDECETLEEIADWWNSENSGNAIGELIVKDV